MSDFIVPALMGLWLLIAVPIVLTVAKPPRVARPELTDDERDEIYQTERWWDREFARLTRTVFPAKLGPGASVFPPTIAYDPASGQMIRNAHCMVFRVGDQSAPIPIMDGTGVPMSALTSNRDGIFPAFIVPDGDTQVVVTCGTWSTVLTCEAALRGAQ